jgi:hypothetical protein
MSNKYWYLFFGIVIGAVAYPQIRKLPLANKLPVA